MKARQTSDRSIAVERLTRRFGDLVAVDGVDLQVASGEIFGFLGPNGAGKSTLVKMLATILAPTSGRATVAGLDVRREQGEVRRAIGVALQEVGLDPLMTARELIVLQAQLFGAATGAARETAERLIATVGLADVDPKKRVGDYSGGMKRRLDLALALAHDPQVLFLDEPTTGLDPASRMDVWDEVRRLNAEQGMTIFLTTQYLEEADKLAERVAIIDHGRLVATGTPAELKHGLGEEVVELAFETPHDAERAAGVLAGAAPQCRPGDGGLRCYFPVAAHEVPGIVRALDQASIPLRGLTIDKPTLDDVFLRATGESLRARQDTDAGGPQPEAGGPQSEAGDPRPETVKT
ncbi:MAG TPA: ATP-binding cassette domain-containing protein [Thermoleophilia bacterium]|nr:ATP-binding cassette domain-containing protein [Thermoleophilia bacterium]